MGAYHLGWLERFEGYNLSSEVWLTGFKPFGENIDNISQIVTESLDGLNEIISLGNTKSPFSAEKRESTISIKSEILDVNQLGSRIISSRLKQNNPQAVVHLGLAQNREKISIETVALNELDFTIPDNNGRKYSGLVDESRHQLLHSSAPINLILSEFEGDERVVKSSDPGRFVCNETYFRSLLSMSKEGCKDRLGRPLPVLFVHLPQPEYIPLEEQIELVKKIIAITVQRPKVEVVGGLLCRPDGTLLAAQRAKDEYMAGFWEFPGGKIELGESETEALTREWMEEFGWEINPIRCCEKYSHAWPEMVVNLSFWVCEPVGELPEAIMTSHDQYRWLKNDELMAVDWLPPDIEFVKRIQEKGIGNL